MYIDIVPNRGSPPAVLLRESYREGNRIRKRTLANLSKLPPDQVELLRAVLRGEPLVPAGVGLEIVRALPHGHVLAALGMARRTKLDRLLPRAAARRAQLALALIVARLIDPASKLATARALDATTAPHSLGATLGLGRVTAKEVYATLDWLGAAQEAVEAALARRHLSAGTLLLYDVTSTYLEGRCCALARHGYSRDGRRDKLQIIVGLMCTAEGCPLAVEVFEGDTGDPATLAAQIEKLKRRFGPRRIVLVGDRGMITSARIAEDLTPAGLDWITALRAPAIQRLAAEAGPLQLSLFDQRDLAEIESPDYPGERLIVCRNPALGAERGRKRAELLDATEQALSRIQARVRRARQPLRGADKIGQAVGAVLGRRKVAKHFRIAVTDDDLSFARDRAQIAAEAALDGVYVLRTNVPADSLSTADTVRAYKSLARIERAFRSLKTVDLELRPVFHWTSPRVRAHVLLCMLAYYLEWHMRQALAPILFAEHDPAAGAAQRASPVAKAQPSPAARRKAKTKRTDDGLPVHSFRSLLADLATLTLNTVRFGRAATFSVLATPTEIQRRAFELLGLSPAL
ncbi:MAG TPA: IS1634 family transposase [Gemmatimonadales bacterium]|nr:IS1634 family transposase [Burkholderiaceae bacterium]HSD33478.1 IS1634 family transposase [Gemmatimonadales bacterium]